MGKMSTTLAATLLACGLAVIGGPGCATSRTTAQPVTPDAGITPQEQVDTPPVRVRVTRPRYPPDAFYREIEGVVELEILIDATGRVARTRIVKSIPELDAAAIRCVMEWRFRPAQVAGRPVATLAMAPVLFRIK